MFRFCLVLFLFGSCLLSLLCVACVLLCVGVSFVFQVFGWSLGRRLEIVGFYVLCVSVLFMIVVVY